MGVAVALAPAPAAKAPAARAPPAPVRPHVVQVRQTSQLLQRACDCGATAGFSGRCIACDRVSLGAGRGTEHAQAVPAAPDGVGGAPRSTGPALRPGPSAGPGLGHDLGRLGIRPSGGTVASGGGAAGARATGSFVPAHPVRVTSPVRVQTQLRVSSPSDPAEQEAHSVGKLIARMAEPADIAGRAPIRQGGSGVAQRQVAPVISSTSGDGATVYRLETGAPMADPDILAGLHRSTSAGTSLPADMLSFMEPRFGADFSPVRIHTDAHAAILCGQLGARAFTLGRDIYFGKGQFRTDAAEGWELIAHELTHTIQQGSVSRPAAVPAKVAEPARPAAPAHAAAPVHAAAPAHVAAPVHAAPPARVAAPVHAAAPAHVAVPVHAAAPAHVAEPGVRAGALAHVAAPVHAAAVTHSATPMHAAAPAQVAAPMHATAPAHAAAVVHAPAPAHVAVPAHAAAPAHVAERAAASVQRLGVSDALGFFADKANMIPGFRMLTIVLGVNPINMSPVDRSAANVLRALVEFIPGGGIITQALQNSGVFDRVGAWVTDQIATLAMTGGALKAAVTTFLGTLSWSDIFDLSGVWERAKRIFTEPIDRLISFVRGLAADILKFIKDAILLPLARLAQGTRGWDLLIAVLGKNPITGDPVARTAETLIGGFLKLIGQDEVWENMKKSNAIPRAWAWFQGAMSAVVAFVSQIPDLFVAAFRSLTIEDVVLVAGAFQKVAAVFGGFLGRFTDWAGTAIWNLLEIIFDVVSPGALTYVKKTGAALKSILRNPLPFVHNLVAAAKLGLHNFASHFGEHLKAGLIDWLTGSLQGVYIPKALSLVELGKFALSVLGITWAQIRGKIVRALGPSGERIMVALETTFDVVVALVRGGPAAAWEVIKEKLTNLKDMVIEGIEGFVVDTIVKKAIPKLVSMFIPGAGFISAILSIYDTVMVFVEKLSRIAAAVKAFVDSIVAIAAGQIEGAANKVESTLAGLLSLAISFLAGFLGLSGIAAKVMAVIERVRATVDRALDTAIAWVVGRARALFARLFGRDRDQPDGATAATVVEPFAMEGAPHTMTVKVSGTSLEVDMASASGNLYNKIKALKTSIAAQKAMPDARRQKIIEALDGIAGGLDFNIMQQAFARSLGVAHTPRPMTDEFVRGYTISLVGKIVALANKYKFKDLVAKAFLPDPLPPQRYIPDPVKSNIRDRLYERGSQWTSVRATAVTNGVASIDAMVASQIVAPLASGRQSDAAAAMSNLKTQGKVLDGAALTDFKANVSYVSPRLSDYAVDHDPSLAEHWVQMGGNKTPDDDRHAAVEGKGPLTLDLVTRSFNSRKSSRSLSGEMQYFKQHAWVSPPFTSAIAVDINNVPNNEDVVAIDGHSLTFPDGTPFVPVS